MTAGGASAEDAALRRFVDAVIELNEKPTPGNVARYLRASSELECPSVREHTPRDMRFRTMSRDSP